MSLGAVVVIATSTAVKRVVLHPPLTGSFECCWLARSPAQLTNTRDRDTTRKNNKHYNAATDAQSSIRSIRSGLDDDNTYSTFSFLDHVREQTAMQLNTYDDAAGITLGSDATAFTGFGCTASSGVCPPHRTPHTPPRTPHRAPHALHLTPYTGMGNPPPPPPPPPPQQQHQPRHFLRNLSHHSMFEPSWGAISLCCRCGFP